MVNTEDFIKRLELIQDYYSLSASGFADKIGVQRSSLSHLLSGRNKPSLDFILKILDVFPEVDLYWILNGKGSFPKITTQNSIKNETEKIVVAPTPIPETKFQETLFNEIETASGSNPFDSKKRVLLENSSVFPNQDKIEKIVVFYTNGTFMEYNPK
ncbi:helix-turn-helix domain-containing protein [Flavobacterium psychrotolerans]|uniref:XRE family transcriptional regulator n=1 Tax=Flavobacterium psychrotolerans TaxID=2169410 RepID=A0A2U1JHX2_9FLAO|nr:helix-turn-helix transcriptional regulator [Flavobacterium psychrotolerans]PWA04727.1 XRE family transcriptional regulator [Flavobacterium psychrotolerans]